MKKINALYVSLAALVLAVAALVVSIVCCSCSSKGGNADVAAALKANPEMVVEAMQAFEAKQREEAMKRAEENIKARANDLYSRADDAFIGNPDGKIVIAEFFDFSCGFCHRVYPALKSIVAKNSDVKIVAKPMTFLSPVSKYAAEAALAAHEQGKFAEVFDALFAAEGRLTEAKVDELVAAKGLDMAKLKEDMKSAKVQKTLNDASDLAGAIQVNGVPTMVLGSSLLQTIDESAIQAAVDAAR